MASRRGASIPPISVFRLGEQHFVDDGHHRVSVAQALGMKSIDAEVVELAPQGG
jgi:ParB-like chromosome segregation protein Spo0J